MNSPIRLAFASFAFLALPGLSRAALFTGENWRDITAEEKSATASTIDPDAGAEVLYQEIKFDDNSEMSGVVIPLKTEQVDANELAKFNIFLRVKVYNERGTEQVKAFHWDPDERDSVTEVVARVINPDGSITPVEKKDIFDRNVASENGKNVERISFALPGVKPGCIIDCIMRGYTRGSANGAFFHLGNMFPTREAHLLVRPHFGKKFMYNYAGFPDGLKPGWTDFLEGVVKNIPADPTEPYSPPVNSLGPWVCTHYAFYTEEHNKPEEFWKFFSIFLDDRARYKIGTSDEIRSKAASLTAGLTDPKEKLHRLYNFCNTDITNIDCAHSGYTRADYSAFDKNDNTIQTLRNGRGHTGDIAILFASLARASGFEVNLALCNDSTIMDWNPNCMSDMMAQDLLVAVKDGNNWTFYQPGVPFLPFGMLRAGNEGVVAILGDPDKASVTQTQIAPASASQIVRTGNFVLDEDGTLHGSGTFKYSGHRAYSAKNQWGGLSSEDRENSFRDAVRELVPGAELSDIEFLNLQDQDKDLEVHFKLSVPGYADVSDERLLFQPSVYEKGSSALFPSETRKTDIRFPYANESHDKIKIQFPATFAVEAGSVPVSLPPSDEIAYTVRFGMAKDGKGVVLLRDHKIALRMIPFAKYAAARAIFDTINQSDHHVISLHRIPIAPATTGTTVPAAPAAPAK